VKLLKKNLAAFDNVISHIYTNETNALFTFETVDLSIFISKFNNIKNILTTDLQSLKDYSLKYPLASNLYIKYISKFKKSIKKFNENQEKYKKMYNDKIKKQVKIINPVATQNEIDNYINNSSNIFENVTLDRRSQSLSALSYVENRHLEILNLEKSVLELAQLYEDFAILVNEETQVINDIESNINVTVNKTETAIENLRTATKHQVKSRKTMCCLLV
jgi:syntaxin 1B/2/3